MVSKSQEKPVISLTIRSESDVVLARKRARQVALLLGFDAADQTRISTAVSEIVRNAFVHAGGGKLEFCIQDTNLPYTFVTTMIDHGPGISDLEEVLKGRQPYFGLKGATNLVDQFHIDTNSNGTRVRLEKKMAPRVPFTGKELDGIANSLTKLISANPTDEVYQQNQELLLALEQLSAVKAQLDVANNELKESNSDLTSLNQQMRDWNISLEQKVKERTAELQQVNVDLLAARDEAVIANELKSQFVANVSHEIRTPLAGILGLAEVLSLGELNRESRELAEHIVKSGQHLLVIVNDLLDFSKLSAGKSAFERKQFYLSSLFDEVVQSVHVQAKKKNIDLSDAIDPAISNCFWGDSGRLKQVILNLTHNAVKFTDNGTVKLRAKLVENGTRFSRIRVEVSDNGIGISDLNQRRLFQPFVQVDGSTTRKHGGTGLGLAISRTIVEQMGGTIGCVSDLGAGSTFYIELPLEKANPITV
ncbi:MAG TPA: ATP-binding protein [Drouetiella sp.]|jgi:signal transduction histidine kinase